MISLLTQAGLALLADARGRMLRQAPVAVWGLAQPQTQRQGEERTVQPDQAAKSGGKAKQERENSMAAFFLFLRECAVMMPRLALPVGEKPALPPDEGLALGQARHGLGGADDGDALVALEVEQMRIAGDDEISVGRYRAGEHVIVVGIGNHDRGD